MPPPSERRWRSSTEDVVLAGALELPARPPFGGVLLLSGSGPQDRDETLAGQRPFRVLRRGLAARGFAVASWDDRGVGGSGGDYLRSSSVELVSDASAVLDQVRGELGDAPLFVAGHSQGALVAAHLAAARSDLDGLVLLAGAGRPGRTVLVDQHRDLCRAEGIDEAAAEALLACKLAAFERLAARPEQLDAAEEAELAAELFELFQREFDLGRDDAAPLVEDLLEWEWRFLLAADPAEPLARVVCPALVLAGAVDLQLRPREDVEAAAAALRSGASRDVEAEVLPGLNHLFQRAETGAPSEYETAGEPFPPEVLDRIAAWLSARADSPGDR